MYECDANLIVFIQRHMAFLLDLLSDFHSFSCWVQEACDLKLTRQVDMASFKHYHMVTAKPVSVEIELDLNERMKKGSLYFVAYLSIHGMNIEAMMYETREIKGGRSEWRFKKQSGILKRNG